jgi:hypothetical protein
MFYSDGAELMRVTPLPRPAAQADGPVAELRDAERLRRYREYQDFYDGKHFPRAQRRGRSTLVLNYAQRAVLSNSAGTPWKKVRAEYAQALWAAQCEAVVSAFARISARWRTAVQCRMHGGAAQMG